ncbi:MAG TPA: hypothetical protein DCQ32_08705 [Cyanobacteria bacterium UBA8156]|jgi:DNA uptake protein ComE-like DNA-binding protein|nr:hypothetical protein [Cyanobacteria bacterium UBA8156]
MTLITTLLEIEAIEYAIPPDWEIDQAKVAQLAQAFLAAKGSINPILVQEINPIKFRLIEGYTEMLAAVRASEIDRNFAEIRAIVVPPELTPSVQAQVELLRRALPPGQGTAAVAGMQLDGVLRAIAQLDKAQQERLHRLEAAINQQVPPPPPTVVTSPLLADFNHLSEEDLVRKLTKAKSSKSPPELARAIVQERERGGPFPSLATVVKRFQGTSRLGNAALLSLLDSWS